LVESAIFFLLGFLTAAFLALLAAPAVSRRARRLAIARARLQSPLSETQARAERDALRGSHAVDLVRLETRLNAAENDRAIRRVQLGRQASRILSLEDLSAERAAEIARQREELIALQMYARDFDVQLGTQEIGLRDLTFQRDEADRGFALARSRISELEMLVDENRAVIASLEAQATSLHVEISDLRRAADAAETERVRLSAALAERMGAANHLRGEFETAAALSVRLLLEFDGRVAEAARLRARMEEIEPRLQRSEAAREEIVLENSGELSLLAERDAALNRAKAEHRDLTSRMAALTETATAKQDALAMQNKALGTSQATMEGALRAARLDRADLQKEIERLRARLSESAVTVQTVSKGDQALRQSIARLGREIARGHEAPDEDEPLASQVVNFARREPTGTTNYAAEGPTGGTLRQDQPIASER
jgi:chromosome segregation ATPase